MKNFYECTFIVNPGLDDAQIDISVSQTEEQIVKNGGQLVSTEKIGRRRLAFPITKKHNGYYASIEFEAEGKVVEKLERFLTLDENVMRFLTLKLGKRELEAKRTRSAMLAESEESTDDSSDATQADATGDVLKVNEDKINDL